MKPNERFEFEAADIELALVRWLNLLLGMARERAMAFAEFCLERGGIVWRGMPNGGPWRAGLDRRVEVTGATLTLRKVEQSEAGREARCVIAVCGKPRWG